MAIIEHTKLTASGLIRTGSGLFYGFLVGTDGANDPTISIFDNTTNSGAEIVPTNTYDASVLGLNGIALPGIHCTNGIYIEITLGGGAMEITVYHSSKYGLGP